MPEVSGDLSCFSCGLRGGGLVRGFPRFPNVSAPYPLSHKGPMIFSAMIIPQFSSRLAQPISPGALSFCGFSLSFGRFGGGLVWGWYPPFSGDRIPPRTCLRGVRILKIYLRLVRRLETLTLHFSAQETAQRSRCPAKACQRYQGT